MSEGETKEAGIDVGQAPTEEGADPDAVFNGQPDTLSPQAQAYALRVQGVREADIPSHTDLSPAEVRETLENQAARAQESHSEEVAIALELDRLDVMLTGLWAAASTGDVSAVDRVLKIGERRDKLLGLHLEATRQRFLEGAGGYDLEGLTEDQLRFLHELSVKTATRSPIGSRKTRGGKPHRSSLKGGQQPGPVRK